MSTPLTLGFEVFPPKAGPSAAFLDNVATLSAVGSYVSVTYGASGSGRGRSVDTVDAAARAGLAHRITPHITAAGQDRGEIEALLTHWKGLGIQHLVALRGDAAPEGGNEFTDAIDLTRAIARIGGFDVSVACYPEGHPKSASPDQEMAQLKAKFDAGASRAITQFFFDIDVFLRFRDRCQAAGVEQAIVPGLLPIASLTALHRFADGCGASVPAWLDARFSDLDDDPETVRTLSVATTVSLAERLIAEGVDHIHLYSLNRFQDARTIARALGFGHHSTKKSNTEEAA